MTNLTISMKCEDVIGYFSLQMVTYSQAGPKCQEVATTSKVSTSGKQQLTESVWLQTLRVKNVMFIQTEHMLHSNSVDFRLLVDY